MGLGLHGGGLESASFLLKQGADVTVTDLRDSKILSPSIEKLEAVCSEHCRTGSIRYVLGRHDIDDFKNAGMVIKNPAVRPDSRFLQAARRIETDISLFLSEIHLRALNIRLTAVTGSKGKSSVASAMYWVLTHLREDSGTAYLGGNITKSPLAFLSTLKNGDDVVLELSSFQLGDLKGRLTEDGKSLLLQPKTAVITAIMPDHLDRYKTMEEYINDKRVIYRGQNSGDCTIAANDDWGNSFLAETKARPLPYSLSPLPKGIAGAWLDGPDSPGLIRNDDGTVSELIPAALSVIGLHQRQNLLAAGLALHSLGLPLKAIREGLASFPGMEHRLEMFHKAGGISFFNDSAATVPQAAAAALGALGTGHFSGGNVILVTGGTDKNLDFTPLLNAAHLAKTIILLAGSGSKKIAELLAGSNINFLGPFDSLEKAAKTALENAVSGDSVAFSPGCASFEKFQNEFDRGEKWKETVRRIAG